MPAIDIIIAVIVSGFLIAVTIILLYFTFVVASRQLEEINDSNEQQPEQPQNDMVNTE